MEKKEKDLKEELFKAIFYDEHASRLINRLIIKDFERAKKILPNIIDSLICDNEVDETLKVVCKINGDRLIECEIKCEFIDERQPVPSRLYNSFQKDDFADVHSFFQINLNLDENKTN